MGALVFVPIFLFMIIGGFFLVDFTNDSIKVYEKEFDEK